VPQSTAIFLALFAAFFIYITTKGELQEYMAALF
jgi:hypothetical protein